MKAVWQDCMFLTQICLICDGKANLYQMYQVSCRGALSGFGFI